MPKKRRVIKKKTKEPDEFISTSDLIIRYVREHSRNVIRIALGVVVVVLIAYGWIYSIREKEKESLISFAQAEQLYKAGMSTQSDYQSVEEQYRLALGEFEDIVKKYKGTSSALKAIFYTADCSYRLKDYDKAIEYYTQVINRSGKGDYLRYFAFEGLGYCYEEKGDYEQALKHFEKSMEETYGSDLKELVYLNMARNYEALNDRENALQYYKKIIDNQEDSLFSELAQDKISALKN